MIYKIRKDMAVQDISAKTGIPEETIEEVWKEIRHSEAFMVIEREEYEAMFVPRPGDLNWTEKIELTDKETLSKKWEILQANNF